MPNLAKMPKLAKMRAPFSLAATVDGWHTGWGSEMGAYAEVRIGLGQSALYAGKGLRCNDSWPLYDRCALLLHDRQGHGGSLPPNARTAACRCSCHCRPASVWSSLAVEATLPLPPAIAVAPRLLLKRHCRATGRIIRG